jgi:hypothetical protein
MIQPPSQLQPPQSPTRDVDKVDDLIDDIREEMDTATHISDAISTPLDSSMQSDVSLWCGAERRGVCLVRVASLRVAFPVPVPV